MPVRNDNAPITIIKKKKVIKGGGHHGGAWKVAYADFVTAMMAFFLLMWLLGSTTESQRKGIADYFSPTIPLSKMSGGGDGAFGGNIPTAIEIYAATEGGADPQKVDEDLNDKFNDIENMFSGDSGESTVEDELLQHVRTRVTDEGLIIEVFDIESSRLFLGNTDAPSRKLLLLLEMVADVIGIVTNNIAVSGHTDEHTSNGDKFTLSLERAQFARQQLTSGGVSIKRVERISGNADRSPSQPDLGVIRNRRIEITLLRRLPNQN